MYDVQGNSDVLRNGACATLIVIRFCNDPSQFAVKFTIRRAFSHYPLACLQFCVSDVSPVAGRSCSMVREWLDPVSVSAT